MIESNLQDFKKATFSQELKKTFRSVIAAGKIDETKIIDQSEIQ